MNSTPIKLDVRSGVVPSFKNTKRAILDNKSGLMRTLTPGPIKKRMQALESGIVSALFSYGQTGDAETDLECRKQLRTFLCGLCDDSLAEIPEFSFGVREVDKGQEGVEIYISEIT